MKRQHRAKAGKILAFPERSDDLPENLTRRRFEAILHRPESLNSGSLTWLCVRDGRLQGDFAVSTRVEYRLGLPP
jgi:hypothetical protein